MTWKNIIKNLEKSPWIMALMVLISNLEFPHVRKDIGEDRCDVLTDHWLVRKLILFSLMFSTTQNLQISLIVTLVYAFLVYYF